MHQVRRTEMETGSPRIRVQSKVRRDHVSVTWKFTLSQYYIFRAWFESPTGAAWGAAWFTIDIPVGNHTSNIKTTVNARFAGQQQWTSTLMNGGRMYSVSATLEVRNV
jgi:hypothetical protein